LQLRFCSDFINLSKGFVNRFHRIASIPLTSGTAVERIGDESLTWPGWLFVHRKIWNSRTASAPHAESACGRLLRFRRAPLTFEIRPDKAAEPHLTAAPLVLDLLNIPNTS